MKVVIESEHVNERSGNKNGRNWSMRTQDARLMGEYVAGRIELTLGDNQPAYAVGTYELDLERSIEIGNYGTPMLSRRLHLVPAGAGGKAAVQFPKAMGG